MTIDDAMLRRAKGLAVKSGRGLADVIDEAKRMLLARRGAPRKAGSEIDLPVFGGSGMLPGVDLEHKDALSVVLGDEDRTTSVR